MAVAAASRAWGNAESCTNGESMIKPTATTRTARWRRIARIASAGFAVAAAAALVTTTFFAVLGLAAAPASAGNWAAANPNDFPDPSVLHVNGEYYGFATQGSARNAGFVNVQVATSSDGVHWAAQPDVDALPNLPRWAVPGNTWAPSVVLDTGANPPVLVMYYVATEASTGDQCIGMASAPANDPTGPYTDSSAFPVVCQDGADLPPATVDNGDYGGSIDPDVFTDSNGDSWLLWKSDGNHVGENAIIWSVPLSSTTLEPTSDLPMQLLVSNQSWQGGVIEGPDMVEEQGSYYLFYAGNNVDTSSYSIGWASCPAGASGACHDQSTAGPWLGSSPGMSGPGGPDVYTLPSGQRAMGFAAWQGDTVGYQNCGWRALYVADLSFPAGGGAPSLTPAIDGAPAASPFCPLPPAPASGYWQVASDGGVFSFGGAQFYGSTGSIALNRPVVGMAATPDGRGYWLVASDGGVFAFGDAGFYGSTGSITLNRPIVAMIPTADGGGYWLFASDGGVFAFGDAGFYGSAAGAGLAYPVTAAARAPAGDGYWMVDSNGQVYSYGGAAYEGGPSTAPLGFHITGMASTPSSSGYWLASANGAVSDYGNASSHGSALGVPLNAPIVGMAATSDGAGYWLQGADGGIFAFGDAPFLGSMGGQRLNAPMVGIASD